MAAPCTNAFLQAEHHSQRSCQHLKFAAEAQESLELIYTVTVTVNVVVVDFGSSPAATEGGEAAFHDPGTLVLFARIPVEAGRRDEDDDDGGGTKL